jgi:general secretion pathway protein G
MRQRNGFSLIEIIFAIIIIGILASVAIPSLNITKNDAIGVTVKKTTMTLLDAITTFYYAKGDLKGDHQQASLSNIIKLDRKWQLVKNSDSTLDMAYLYNGAKQPCLVIEVRDNFEIRVLIADSLSLPNSECSSIREQFGIDNNNKGNFEFDFLNSSPNGAQKKNYIIQITKSLNDNGIKW